MNTILSTTKLETVVGDNSKSRAFGRELTNGGGHMTFCSVQSSAKKLEN
jgi:hypothetical protein